MATETVDPIQLFAQLNPVSAEQLNELGRGPERETTLARIDAQRAAVSRRTRLPRRRLAVAAVVAVALAVPALAFSGVLGGLLGFSNKGTPVAQVGLSALSALDITGAKPGTLVRLAARDGMGVYAAKTASGDLCFYLGPPARGDLEGTRGLGGGCMNATSASFPSPTRPVWDMSLFELGPPPPGATVRGPSVKRLTGVAADGVTSIQVLALADCHVVATAPVIDNVYVADNLPTVPESVIVARDASGNAVWHELVTPPGNPNATSCGL